MTMQETYQDLIENPTPRCACALVLDISASMQGDPIEQLNEGVIQLFGELLEDDYAKHSVELGIFTFGGEVRTVMDFAALKGVDSVRQDMRLTAGGNTPMGAAVKTAMNALENRKQGYKKAGVSYYQPWLIIMTDGVPTDSWQDIARQLRQNAEEKKVVVFGIGIGPNCDMQVLQEFCPENRPPKNLQGLKFKEFFAWLSQSMSAVSQSSPGDKINLPSTKSWDSVEL